VGVLLKQISETLGSAVDALYLGMDLSETACHLATKHCADLIARPVDFEERPRLWTGEILLCTEVLEHLTLPAVEHILQHSQRFSKAFFMVPNACFGPEVEPQHLRQWSAKDFLDLLKTYHPSARVEVFHDPKAFQEKGHRGYLLGICGYEKQTTLSFTMPVKDEGADIERVLSSFRGVADQIIIGIDDKTTDDTEALAKLYADDVFYFTWENDFSKARNQCIDRCTCDWVFMSEGHEHLKEGWQVLLQLEEIPSSIKVLEVRRESENYAWFFPWLFRNHLGIHFKNAVHNELDGYDGTKDVAQAHQIATWHERDLKKAWERAKQRQGMNKQELLRKVREGSIRDMYYLGTEYSDLLCSTCKGHGQVLDTEKSNGTRVYKACPDCQIMLVTGKNVSLGTKPFGVRQAIYWYERFLAASNHRPMPLRYQARLSLARWYRQLERYTDAKRVLAEAIIDDATRTEHWLLLGDLCEEQGQIDLATRFYEYASIGIGRPPISHVFLEKSVYTYLPAQKLTSVYAEQGDWENALKWARQVPVLLPEWAPPQAFKEAQHYIDLLEVKANESPIQL
jgi:glycosyltransferase involved in cell wall biosynthesis